MRVNGEYSLGSIPNKPCNVRVFVCPSNDMLKQGCTTQTFYIQLSDQVKKYKKLLLIDRDFMNEFKVLNFIELLTSLQLITIQNSSDGSIIKSQAIKRLFT